MKRARIQQFMIVFLATYLIGSTGYSKDAGGDGATGLNMIAIATNDVPGAVVRKVENRPWTHALDADGKPVGAPGILQEVEIKGINARIHCGEFAGNEEAHKAAEFHTKNMAAVFKPGLWDGATKETIGDETWYSRGSQTTAILVRAGRTCALLSCRNGQPEDQARVAILLAECIARKIADADKKNAPAKP